MNQWAKKGQVKFIDIYCVAIHGEEYMVKLIHLHLKGGFGGDDKTEA